MSTENRSFTDGRRIKELIAADTNTTFTVASFDFDALGKLIDKWGKQLMDMSDPETDEALKFLAFTKDPRTIIFLAEALERYGRKDASYDERERTRQITFALSPFNSEFALHALKREMANSHDDIRLWVADALSESHHPEAIISLLQMSSDKYWFVRLRVVQKLGKLKSATAQQELRGFLNDENEDVRKQAEMYLKVTP